MVNISIFKKGMRMYKETIKYETHNSQSLPYTTYTKQNLDVSEECKRQN